MFFQKSTKTAKNDLFKNEFNPPCEEYLTYCWYETWKVLKLLHIEDVTVYLKTAAKIMNNDTHSKGSIFVKDNIMLSKKEADKCLSTASYFPPPLCPQTKLYDVMCLPSGGPKTTNVSSMNGRTSSVYI